MSVQAITWALSFDVKSPTEKAVLLVLANYADGDGVCFPGQDSIARQAACTDRTVRAVLTAFEERGIIARVHRQRRDGSRTSDEIRLIAFGANRKDAPEGQPENASAKPTGNLRASNRKSTSTQPEQISGLTTFEPSEEPSGEPSPSLASPSPSPERVAFDDWNDLAKRLGLPVASKLTDQRLKHLRTRIRQDGLDAWRAALRGVEFSRHCRGENDRGWRADIDFVLQPKSFTRLIEGFYGSDAKTSEAVWDDDRWRGVLALHRDEGWWSDKLGPPPGQPGCRAPPHLLNPPLQAAA